MSGAVTKITTKSSPGTPQGFDPQSNLYQATLATLVFPLWAHLAFNAMPALSFFMIGYPYLAAVVLVANTGIDAFQQLLLRRWIPRAAEVDEARGLNRIAWLSAVRVTVYTGPALYIVVSTGGFAEFAVYAVQFACLLTVAMGAGSMSRRVFWGFAGPLLLGAAVIGVARFPPLQASAVLFSLVALLLLMLMISQATTTSVKAWNAAFRSHVLMMDELAAARDQAVAERQAADEAREAARAASRAKSNFLATMSHEIRTPMNGVLGMAQLLRREEASPRQVERIDVLIESGQFLMSILNDILDISKIDAGKLEVSPSPERLRPFLERLIVFWTPRADERALRLSLDIRGDLPEAVSMDALRLRQVMFNLIGNALKFTEEGSVEVVAESRLRDDGRVDLHLQVRDTGPGIAEAQLGGLFEPFSQVDQNEARRFGGTGLGLAIVSQLVGLMGGRVWVESRLGRGSDFHVEIPLEVAESPSAAVEGDLIDLEEAASSLRVLVVDDNAVNLLVLEQLLASLGQSVTTARSGFDALDILGAEAFDLVLLDIHMPGMTGTEMLQRLRETPGPNRDVPVIALTADVTSGGRQSYIDQGFTDHASKPIQLEDLLSAIVRAVSAPRAAPQAA